MQVRRRLIDLRSIKTLYIDRDVAGHPITERIKETLEQRGVAPAIVTDDVGALYRHVACAEDPVGEGKQNLLLTQNKGPFIKKCPGTRYYQCCNYQILHIASFCNMDCAYCILQTYFHPPLLQFFVNQEKLFLELEALYASGKITRTGTGEFTDSLIWESVDTELTPRLVNAFARQDTAVLELKTKTTDISALKAVDHNRKIIMAWSLNTPEVIRSEERSTTSLTARLKAARQCQDWGYPLAFHFDPVIMYEGCEHAYEKVIKTIFDYVSPDNIVWISLGTFRYMPALKPIIQKRFPESKIIYGEQILGLDGKLRYFKPLRIALYRALVNAFRKYAPDVCVYYCMEDDAVWRKTMGFVPAEVDGLPALLDRSAIRHCRLKP